jgi:lipopolysaccharide/colanic/teichoic acid biosynthesis glycosyltransferase
LGRAIGMFYRRYGKRVLDVAIAAIGLLVAAPVLLVAGLAVLLTMGRPVLFPQERAGLHGAPFRAWKVRTMSHLADGMTAASSDSERIPAIGRWLRRTSVDELPQLWNVLRGEMSVVGPRPLLLRYADFYDVDELDRFSVRPGITGWAQVNGRNDLPWDTRLKHDIWYVRHCSFALDLRILWRTIQQTVSGAGFRADPRSALGDLDQVRSRRA